jgi:hypothetical protein
MVTPVFPIRKVVGVILLGHIFNLSDERVVSNWRGNPYWQHFCGEVNFQHEPPFDPSELIKFRKQIGETGAEKLLKLSIDLFERKEIEEKAVLIDTTVQEKNITFPHRYQTTKENYREVQGNSSKRRDKITSELYNDTQTVDDRPTF